MKNKSDNIGKFAAALSKAQKALPAAKKSSKAHHAKYADLAEIQETLRGPLTDNGLSYVQCVSGDGNAVSVETVGMHESGEWLSGTITMVPVKKDPQSIGSCITYAKRYGLSAFFGVQTCDDDDGDAASNVGKTKTRVPQKSKEEQFADAILKMVDAFGKIGIKKEEIPVLVGLSKFSDIKPEHLGELKTQYVRCKEEYNA